MLDFILSLFRKKSVDSILSGVNRNIEQLNALAESERNTAEEETRRANELVRSADAREKEARRAYSVASRLANLIG